MDTRFLPACFGYLNANTIPAKLIYQIEEPYNPLTRIPAIVSPITQILKRLEDTYPKLSDFLINVPLVRIRRLGTAEKQVPFVRVDYISRS